MRIAIALAVIAAARVAAAQPSDVTQSILPGLFATSAGTTIETRVDYTDLDGTDAAVVNAFARGQYITSQGLGGYVAIPFGYIEDQGDTVFTGGAGIGNIEVGGLFVTRTSPVTDVLLRAGIAIDTTAQEDEIAVVISAVLPRLPDAYTSGLETTWGRGQAQIRHASGNLRLGAALGMDVPIAGDAADRSGFNALIGGVLSAGVQQGLWGIGASFVSIEIVDSDADNENFKSINLGGDYLMSPSARLFGSLGLGIGDNANGLSFGIGVRATF